MSPLLSIPIPIWPLWIVTAGLVLAAGFVGKMVIVGVERVGSVVVAVVVVVDGVVVGATTRVRFGRCRGFTTSPSSSSILGFNVVANLFVVGSEVCWGIVEFNEEVIDNW